MARNFNEWLSKFKSSISNYGYYVDFEKIYKSAEKYKVELNNIRNIMANYGMFCQGTSNQVVNNQEDLSQEMRG